MGKKYTVSDGTMMIQLEEAAEGGYVVTSPLDPGLVTQAKTLPEAFRMAYDAAECLAYGRERLAERLGYAIPEGSSAEPTGDRSKPPGASMGPSSPPGRRSRRSFDG